MKCDKRLNRKIQQLEGEPVPPDLRNKLMADAMTAAASARAHTTSPSPEQFGVQGVWKMRRVCLAAVFAVLMVGVGLWLLPSRQSGFAIADMAEAMAKVSTVHFTGYTVDEDGSRRNLEGWVKGANKIRIKVEGKADIADDGSRLIAVELDDLPKVTIRGSGDLPGLARGMTYLDLFNRPGALGSAIEASGAEVTSAREVTLDGRKCLETELKGDSGTRMRIFTDTATKLLARAETYGKSGRLVESIERVQYNTPVADSAFTLSVPKNLPVLNMVSPEPDDFQRNRKAEFERLQEDPNAYMLLSMAKSQPGSSCGALFHPDFRFKALGSGFFSVHYLADKNVYRILGKGRAYNGKEGWQSDVVEDGDIRLPGEPQIEEVLMLNGRVGDYCGKGRGGVYRFLSIGPGPATVTYHKVSEVFLIRGTAKVLPTGKVYRNEVVKLDAAFGSDIAEYVNSGGRLDWGGLPQQEIVSMKADLDVALRLAETGVRQRMGGKLNGKINGAPVEAFYGSGGTSVNGISIRPVGPGTRMHVLESRDEYYVLGRARIMPGDRIVRNAFISKQGEIISSEE